jgi:hypothetical protein
MEDTITKLRTPEEAIAVLEKEYPHGVDLIYIDYRDSFDESLEALNRAIQLNNIHEAWPDEPDWFTDAQGESLRYILDENFTTEELEEWGENTDNKGLEQIEAWLYDHDTSTPAEDLLRNTGNKLFFYDTGLEIPEYPQYQITDKQSNAFVAKHAKRIAKKLKIDYTKHLKDLHSLVAEGSYGGKLVCIFYNRPDDMLGGDICNAIKFPKAHLVIMDRNQGSGSQETIDEEVVLPFNRKNLWIDAVAGGYSIDSVFGFYLPAFDQNPRYVKVDKIKKIKTSDLHAETEKYAEWDKDLKKGICHFEDPRFNSHKTEYRMDFPMGNKCVRCGRFYVD